MKWLISIPFVTNN